MLGRRQATVWTGTSSRWRRGRAKATVFQGFWHGPPLGPVREACLRSFVAQGHEFHLYTYDAVTVPDGVTCKQAEAVVPRSEMFQFQNPFTGQPDLGPFSDLFRFRLLNRRGGWWSDVDTVCGSPDIPEVESAWAPEMPEMNPRSVGSSQIALAARSPLSRRLDSECTALSRQPLEYREVLGPRLISRVLEDMGLPPSNFGTANSFYPLRWIEAFKLWLPQYFEEVAAKTSAALFIPVYQSFPHYLGLDVGMAPPVGSYLHAVCERFGVQLNGARAHEVDDVLAGIRRFFAEKDWALQELDTVSGPQTLPTLDLS